MRNLRPGAENAPKKYARVADSKTRALAIGRAPQRAQDLYCASLLSFKVAALLGPYKPTAEKTAQVERAVAEADRVICEQGADLVDENPLGLKRDDLARRRALLRRAVDAAVKREMGKRDDLRVELSWSKTSQLLAEHAALGRRFAAILDHYTVETMVALAMADLEPTARRGQLLCVAVDLHDVEIVEAVAALREDPEDDDAPGFFSTTDPQAFASRLLDFLPAFAGRFFSGEIAGDIAIVVSFGCIAAYSLPSGEALS